MGYYLRLWIAYAKSKLRPRDQQYAALAEETIQRGAALGDYIMENERAALIAEGLDGLFDATAMLGIELQFLWGVFHEFVQEYRQLPTNGFDRIKLHLIEHLIRVHGYTLEHARDEVKCLEGMYNEGDNLFEAISKLGIATYHDNKPGRLCVVVKTLQDSRVRAMMRQR